MTFAVHPEELDPFLGRRGFNVAELALASELRERYAPGERAALDDSFYVVLARRLEELPDSA